MHLLLAHPALLTFDPSNKNFIDNLHKFEINNQLNSCGLAATAEIIEGLVYVGIPISELKNANC